MDKYKKMVFILFIFGFVIPSYGNVYQEEQSSQEEKKTCPLLFALITAENVDMSTLGDVLRRGRNRNRRREQPQLDLDPNESLEGCRGDERYDRLPEGSTLLHVAAHLGDEDIHDRIYSLLRRNGADETATDENGDTPRDIRNRR